MDIERKIGKTIRVTKARSPCVSQCGLGAGDFCVGCGRALGDIVNWSAMDEQERHQASERASARKNWRRMDGGMRAMMMMGSRKSDAWCMSGAMAWFKEVTAGMVVVLDAESWGRAAGHLLTRPVAVVTKEKPVSLRQSDTDVRWSKSLDEVEEWAFEQEMLICLGGGVEVWNLGWPQVAMVWMTRIKGPTTWEPVFEPDLTHFEYVAEGPQGSEGDWRWSSELWSRKS